MNIRYLHLSDFHLTGGKDPAGAFRQESVTRSMAEYIESLAKRNELNVDFIVITGDVADKARTEDYKVAEAMCQRLLRAAGLGKERLFVVPGNHDIDRATVKEWQEGIYAFKDQDYITSILSDPESVEILKKKFRQFDAFAESIMEWERCDDLSFCFAEPLTVEKNGESATINMLGLNSAIFCGFREKGKRPSASKMELEKLALGRIQVESAIQRMEKDAALTVAFFHHPFETLHPMDKPCRNLLLRHADLILNGHIHSDWPEQKNTKEGGATVIGAGASYVSESGKYSFNIVEIDLLSGQGRETLYSYQADSGIWIHDRNFDPKEADGAFPFTIESIRGKNEPDGPASDEDKSRKIDSPKKREEQTNPELEEQIRQYLEKAAGYHESLPLAGFKTKLLVPIRIEEIYVPLRAMVHLNAIGGECFGTAEEAEDRLGRGACEEIPLKNAFVLAEKLKRKGLVILGDPGSGKTTHLKRLLLYCANQGPEELGLPEDMVPVFLPLRDLKALETGLDSFIQEQLSGPHLDTPPDFGEKLMKRGNLLLLLDGLDEVSDPKHRQKVSRWIENAMKFNHKNCRFVVTSRFAGYSEKARLNEDFLEMHVRPLSEEQAERFIRNWYEIVESGVMTDEEQARIVAGTKADQLIERLKAPEYRARRVFEMTRNPLLLANLCLVHRARGDLPRTRARLYEECVDVLLERWRQGGGISTRITADKGRRVLQPAAYWMHGKEGRTRARGEELTPVIEPSLQAVGWEHGGAKGFLETVRDESGILAGWGDGTFGFMHLGFQEYLAAWEIRSMAFGEGNVNDKVLRDLSGHFGESWYQEVILLLLALEEPPLFVPFMREVVKRKAFYQNSETLELCMDEAAEKFPGPFSDLIKKEPGENKELWKRQMTALRVLDRWVPSALGPLMPQIRNHPYSEIRRWAVTSAGEKKQETIRPEPSGYELVWVPGGEFEMGSTEDDWEKPVHRVSLEGFYMGRFTVTNREYGRFLEATGYREPVYWADRKYNQPDQPVVGVSWSDAKAFGRWAGLSLPSEAQWEYACRAGTTTRYYAGDLEEDLEKVGWYNENSGGRLHSVGEKGPNDFGLYDMHGNVWEWCEDDYHDSYEGAPEDGTARVYNPRGSGRVVRGGSWFEHAGFCRAAFRFDFDPSFRLVYLGFRLVFLPGRS